jgi:hypothetical protein
MGAGRDGRRTRALQPGAGEWELAPLALADRRLPSLDEGERRPRRWTAARTR